MDQRHAEILHGEALRASIRIRPVAERFAADMRWLDPPRRIHNQ